MFLDLEIWIYSPDPGHLEKAIGCFGLSGYGLFKYDNSTFWAFLDSYFDSYFLIHPDLNPNPVYMCTKNP